MHGTIIWGIVILFSKFEWSVCLPSLHPAIWNHDGMRGGSLLGLHDFQGERSQVRLPREQTPKPAVTPPPPPLVTMTTTQPTTTSQSTAAPTTTTTAPPPPPPPTDLLTDSGKRWYPPPDAVLLPGSGPSYENSINPFLSHLEQGWKLKPVKHRYMRKKVLENAHLSPQQRQKMGQGANVAEEIFGPLPADPNKPHFMESGEASEAEENHSFGHEEKDFGDMLRVLFSPDYAN